MVALRRVRDRAAGEKRAPKVRHALRFLLQHAEIHVQRQTGFEVHLQRIKNFRNFVLRRDRKLKLPPVLRRGLSVKRNAERLFKELWKTRGKITTFGDDADLCACERVAVQKHAVALCHRAGSAAHGFFAELRFDVG